MKRWHCCIKQFREAAAQNRASMQKDFTAKAKAKNEERKKQSALVKAITEQNLTAQKDEEGSKNLAEMRERLYKSIEFMSSTIAKTAKFMPTTDQVKSIIDKHSNENFESMVIQRSVQSAAYIQLNFVPNKPFTDNGLSFEAKVFDAVSNEKIEEIFEREVPRANLITDQHRILADVHHLYHRIRIHHT